MHLPMILSNKGTIEIATYEGICLRPYFDSVGVITIGIGSTVTELPSLSSWDKQKYITMQYACDLFRDSLVKYSSDVNSHVSVPLSQYQFDALVSIAYNIGSSGEDHSTFLKDINNHESISSIVAAILLWDIPKEIEGRRHKEANLFSKGIYSSNGFIELLDTDGRGHQLASTSKNIDISPYFQ